MIPIKPKIVAVAMIAVLQNRVAFNKPKVFCAPTGSMSLRQFATAVCAHGSAQFAGFTMDGNGNVTIDQNQAGVIDGILTLAENGDQDCIDHINMIIGYANSNVLDPYANNIPANIDGSPVFQNVYGWRSSGTGTGGNTYKLIPTENNPPGVMQGIQFLALVNQPY